MDYVAKLLARGACRRPNPPHHAIVESASKKALLATFENLQHRRAGDQRAPNKPLLAVWAIGWSLAGEPAGEPRLGSSTKPTAPRRNSPAHLRAGALSAPIYSPQAARRPAPSVGSGKRREPSPCRTDLDRIVVLRTPRRTPT